MAEGTNKIVGKAVEAVKGKDMTDKLKSVWESALAESETAMKDEFKSIRESLKSEGDLKVFDSITAALLRETLDLYKAETEVERSYHQRNLNHLKNAVRSFESVAKIKVYDAIVSIAGRVLAGVVKAAIVSGLAL